MYVVTERVDNQAFVASLLWAAQQGAIDLTRDGDTWTITDKAGQAGWAKLDPVTAAVAPLLGGPGGTFQASAQRRRRSGKVLQSRIAAFETETARLGQAERLPDPRRPRAARDACSSSARSSACSPSASSTGSA